MKIADIAPEQRPRERLFAGRGDEMSDADLLALIWGSGQKGRNIIEMAQEILTLTGGLRGLMSLGLSDLSGLPGLGPAKVGQLWAVQEVARRSKRGGPKARMASPRDAGEYLVARCEGWTEEHFGLLALNSKGEVTAERILSKGSRRHAGVAQGILQGGHAVRRVFRHCLPQPPQRRLRAEQGGPASDGETTGRRRLDRHRAG